MHSWFESYLSERTQYTIINEAQSASLKIDYGVPQGSVLGPLPFLLYINDIGAIPNLNFKPKLFADDTNVFINNSNLSTLNTICQLTINKISEWLLANRLTVNYDKTCYMIFSPTNVNITPLELKLNINNSVINKVASTKYLGIQIDENLNWKFHINELCLSLRKYVGVFYKLSLKLPPNVLKLIYYSIIYPRILYGIEVYANTYMINLHDLMILNNRILRIIQHKPITTNTNELYTSFNTLPINKLFQYQMLIHAHAVYFRLPSLPDIFKNKRQL